MGSVEARTGKMEEHLPINVAEVGENLLGLDYLQESMAVLYFREMTMEVGGNLVVLQEDAIDAGECAVSIETHKAHTAPPPEVSHHCCLRKELEGDSLVSPVTQPSVSKEIAVGRTAVSLGTEDEHGIVAGLSSQIQVRPAGQVLGMGEGMQVARNPEGQFEDTQESSTGVPPHLQGLMQWSLVCLSGEQVNKVKEVLTQYATVISKGDHNLGWTSLVKHHIHTRNSRTVKLPPQRIVPAQRTEV